MSEFELPVGDEISSENIDDFSPAVPAEPTGFDALDAIGAPNDSSAALE